MGNETVSNFILIQSHFFILFLAFLQILYYIAERTL